MLELEENNIQQEAQQPLLDIVPDPSTYLVYPEDDGRDHPRRPYSTV
jgi:hypothetical protein